AEDFLLSQALLPVHLENRRGDEEAAVVPASLQFLSAGEQVVPLFPADLDVVEDLLLLVQGGHRPHVRLLVDRIADPEFLRALDEFVDDFPIDLSVNNQTRGGGTPLSRGPKRPE